MVTRTLAFSLLVALSVCSQVYAQDPDPGAPDSVYFLEPDIYYSDCSGLINVDLPIYLSHDEEAQFIFYHLYLQPGVSLEGVTYSQHYDSLAYYRGYTIDSLTLHVGFALLTYDLFPPRSGLFAVLHLTAVNDSAYYLYSDEYHMIFCFAFEYCHILTYYDLTSDFVVDVDYPIAGDCDCSGFVNVSDGVFLIQYIFGGGTPPYDLNSADVNADCVVNVSDAVYLISYVFGAGPPPEEGCVP